MEKTKRVPQPGKFPYILYTLKFNVDLSSIFHFKIYWNNYRMDEMNSSK